MARGGRSTWIWGQVITGAMHAIAVGKNLASLE